MNISPPKYALRFLRWFCREDFIDEIEGDLIEIFEHQYKETPRGANWTFIWQVLLHFRPDFIKSFRDHPLIYPGMLKHNLLITYRGFMRHKSSFLINLLGLSTGLACVFIIYLWVADELSIDKFHKNDRQLYQVMQNRKIPQGIITRTLTPTPLTPALTEEIPEVAAAISISADEERPRGILSTDGKEIVADGIYTTKNYFQAFSYDLRHGKPEQVLADKNNIVLSQALALKLFPSTTDIIGKSIEWRDRVFQVSGIFSGPPPNSTKQFDFVLNMDVMLERDEYAGMWNGDYAETYVILKEGTDVDQFNEQIGPFLKSKDPGRDRSTLFVQQYSKRYLHARFENGVQAGGRIAYVRLFSLTAFFILLIACINFMNLSTALATRKMKEIGVKKAMGAQRKSLVFQFLSEAVLMSLLSLIIALGWVALVLPQFNLLTDKSLHLNINAEHILIVLGIVISTGLIAGSYPALYLSKFKPVAVLKGVRATSSGEQWLRKGLVVFQFALSVIFIVGVLVVNRQMDYIQTKNIGFNRDHVISFERARFSGDPDVFLSELRNTPGVISVANMWNSILGGGGGQSGYSWRGEVADEDFRFKSPLISYNVVETLGMDVLAGRGFSKEHGDDDSKIVINEAALNLMAIENPIGEKIKYGDDQREIIGVVGDFHYGSIHHLVEPLIFRFARPRARNIMVRIQEGTEKSTLAKMEALYTEFHPPYPFEYTFLDEDYQQLHVAESRVATLSKYFTGLAILISCLGLLGLAAFTAEQRTKEIGIRKILGASVFGIVRLLSADFTKMVILAILLALPISYFMTKNWLAGFAYKIDLEWWYFVAAASVTFFIAWFTVGLQTLKAARVNPATSLRDE